MVNALGTAVYIAVVSWFLFNSGQVFGKARNFWGLFALLLLLVISVVTVGTLVFGKPLLLYIEGKKKAGIDMFLCLLAWLAIIGVLIFIIRPW